MRLVDADALIEKADYLFKSINTETVDFMQIGYNHAVADVIAIAKNIPTADIMEQKRGKWEEHGEPNEYGEYTLWYYTCSRCGAVGIPQHNYCPNCGAHMREES